MVELCRVDDRMLHGQVAVTWVNQVAPDAILIANDEAATNEMSKLAFKMAKPAGVKLAIKTVKDAAVLLNDPRTKKTRIFLIVRTVQDALELAKSFDWMDDVAYMERYNIGMGNLPGEEMYLTILGGLLGKMGDLRLCAAKSDDAYTPDELMDDLYTYIWDGTIGKRALDEDERFMQRAFVAGIMATSAVAESASAFEKPERRMPFIADTKLVSWSPDTRSLHREEQRLAAARLSGTVPYSGFDGHYAAVKGYNAAPEFYSMLLRVRDLLKQNLASSSGDTREHYEYLLYRIGKALSKK